VKGPYVTIRGEVKSPSRYPLHTGMTLGELILAAGGYTEEAEVLEAEVARLRPGGLGGDSLTVTLRPRLPVQLVSSAVRAEGGEEEFVLQHRDEILVKANPRYRLQQNVVVEGEMTYPGTYALRYKGERLKDVLARAGGPTKTSYLGGAQLYRGGKRLMIDFQEAVRRTDDVHNVMLVAGDRIVVPVKPNTVLVDGEVNARGLFSYREGEDVSDYITRAGGVRDSADYALLTMPSGETRKVSFGWFASNPVVPDGSQIVVTKVPAPKESEPVDVGGTVKDVFAILASAATVLVMAWIATN
jgi:protein involved in polysaccharide export with SLBB domain